MWASWSGLHLFGRLLRAGIPISLTWGMLAAVTPLGAQPPIPSFSDLFEDRVEQLTPKHSRSEGEEDRLLAAAQFAHGRMLLHREKTNEALGRFQRAFRHDPSMAIAREIMATAGDLNRHAVAVRYAILAAEIHTTDGDLTMKLAAFVTEQGDFARALRLLEKAAQAEQPPTGLNLVVLRAEMLRLYLLTGQVEPAAKAADLVQEALQAPEKAGITASDQAKLTNQRHHLDSLIAESYLRSRRWEDAESALRAIHQARPNEASLNFHLARIAAEQKNWKGARDRLNGYFQAKASQSGFEPYELLERILKAEARDEAGARAQLLAALQELRKQDPANHALGYFTAEKMLAANDLNAAATLYEELLIRQPTTTAYRQLAEIYRRKKDPAALLQLLGRAVDQTGVRELLDAEAPLIGKDKVFFEQLLQRLRDSQPVSAKAPSASARVGVALIALVNGRVEVARELYQQAQTVPGVDVTKIRETIGMAALVADQPQFGIEVFEQAIAANPPKDKLAAYHYYVSGALAFAGQTDKALVAAEKCAALRPDSAQFHARPPWVLYHAKRWDEAEQRYRAFLERFDHRYDSEETREQLRQARLVLSHIGVMQKRLSEAEEWLEQVLDEYPEYVGALNDLGYLWADQGKRLQRAARMCEQAVAKEPDNAAYRDSLGWAYYRLGRYADAVRELEQAAVAGPDGVILDHLGDAYFKLENRSKALEAWRKSISLLESSDEASERALVAAKIKQYSGNE